MDKQFTGPVMSQGCSAPRWGFVPDSNKNWSLCLSVLSLGAEREADQLRGSLINFPSLQRRIFELLWNLVHGSGSSSSAETSVHSDRDPTHQDLHWTPDQGAMTRLCPPKGKDTVRGPFCFCFSWPTVLQHSSPNSPPPYHLPAMCQLWAGRCCACREVGNWLIYSCFSTY